MACSITRFSRAPPSAVFNSQFPDLPGPDQVLSYSLQRQILPALVREKHTLSLWSKARQGTSIAVPEPTGREQSMVLRKAPTRPTSSHLQSRCHLGLPPGPC